MRLREILRHEVGDRLRSRATWAYFAILLLVSGWMFLAVSDGAQQVNAPESLAGATALAGMLGLLVTAALFADAALRDFAAGMDPLLFSAPIHEADWLGGRFLGALVVNALVAMAIPLGILFATWLASIGGETVGPIHLRAHVEPYFTLLLPNLVFTGAVLFAVAATSRQATPVYLTAVALVIGTIALLNYADHFESDLAVAAVDPLGIATLMRMTALWTEAERNTHFLGLPAELALDRALWLAIAVLVLALLHRTFRFAPRADGRHRRRRRKRVELTDERSWPIEVPRVAGAFGTGTALRQTLAIAGSSLREIAASRWFVVVLIACTGLTMLWGWNVGDTVFDTSTWPVTLLIVEVVLSARNGPLFSLLIVLYAGELVWRQRDSGTGPIADAAPVSEASALAGRSLALTALVVMFLAAAMLGGILIQTCQGYHHLELGLYLRAVFGMRLAELLILAALAMTIHVVVDHRYLGHLVVVLAILTPSLLQALGIRHHLLLYDTTPGWSYSDMNGFGPFTAPFVWFELYWGAWALLLLVVAALLWMRGPETQMRRRLRVARQRLAGGLARTAAVAIALIVLFGGFVFYNTNVRNEYVPPSRAGARQAAYETRYARYDSAPQPMIERARLRVEIYPDDRAVRIGGTFTLVNRTGAPIDSVQVVLLDPSVEARRLEVAGATATLVDDEVGFSVFALAQPLAPADSIPLDFDVAYRSLGFPNADIPTDVVGNGTRIDRRMMPFVGYQPMFELSDARARQRFGLPPQRPADRPEARMHRWGPTDADLVSVETIIGTAADQTAITPGVLRRTWMENGRRYVEYATQQPIAFGGTVVSARYAVLEDRWRDVPLRIFHHPGHRRDLDSLMHGMKAALDFLSERFAPYPYRELRIVETPRYGGFGSAHPLTIAFTEDAFFARVREGELDQSFYGAAHEVAHTWWGGLVRGGAVPGAGFLTESLANYSAMVVTERTFGEQAGRRVYDFQMERYLRGRARQGHEVPVLDVGDQPYLAYRKGAIALYTLRDLIGGEAVNRALRRYFERFRDAPAPYPTSRDLYAELRAVTPQSLQPLLTDLFETVTLWDVSTDSASAARTADGDYVVTMHVTGRKLRADEDGDETEVPMDDPVQVGIFAAGESAPLYLARHTIHDGAQTIRVTVPRAPARAGVDPYRRLIERKRDDNVVDVTTAS